jgi:MoaA/NifB/PqqE/SkfB family radical SAM enzyme
VQVEVTTYCQAACRYCPRTAWREIWQNRHLPREILVQLLPSLKRTGHVHLQGWGEPLLHPHFFDLVALARAAGCRVGTTTNGLLITKETAVRLVESGLDVVAFSLAGIGETHNVWRPGTTYRQVLEAIRTLQDVKARLGRTAPAVNIAYMLLRSGLKDLDRLPDELAGLGLGQVVISTLDLVPAPELARESLAAAPGPEQTVLSARLEAVAAAAARQGFRLHYPLPPAGADPRRCPENVLKALIVSAQGTVSPCVFLNLPEGGIFYSDGRPHPCQPLAFGSLQEHSLTEIWWSRDWERFRAAWAGPGPPFSCRHCLKLPGRKKLAHCE